MSEARCPKGHTWPAGYRFCPSCGSRVVATDERLAVRASDPAERVTQTNDHQPVSATRSAPLETSPDGTEPEGPGTAAQQAPRRSTVVTAAAVILVATALVGFGVRQGLGEPASARTTSVYGTLLFFDAAAAQNNCTGTGEYSDVAAGARVTLRNQDGAILSSTGLGQGTKTSTAGVCRFVYLFADVPTTETQYSLEVPHRDPIVKANADMVAANWTFNVTLGRP